MIEIFTNIYRKITIPINNWYTNKCITCMKTEKIDNLSEI